jgi:predicted Rossmann fold flavoprotein
MQVMHHARHAWHGAHDTHVWHDTRASPLLRCPVASSNGSTDYLRRINLSLWQSSYLFNIIVGMPSQHPIVIIGAGGAGLIAAWRTAAHDVPTLLLERNKKSGIKILISGGGKCNVTHDGPLDEVLTAFSSRESRFLKHAFYRFSNADLIELLRQHGVPTITRPNGRVFPESNRAHDVVQVFEHIAQAPRSRIRFNASVNDVIVQDGAVVGVQSGGSVIPSSHIILATGGVSYPKTGSTGDGYRWAASAGHSLVPLAPALAPIGIKPPLPAVWRGIALRQGRLSVVQEERIVAYRDDDVLFTHEGVSGPAALELSNAAYHAAAHAPSELRFDFFPGKEFDVLDNDLLARIATERSRTIGTLLDAWLPNRMVDTLLANIGVDPSTRGYTLARDERRRIVHLLKGWTIGRVGYIEISRGEVTAGGISLAEIDPRTMRSTIVRGLYLCGEVLDVAGPVGGYNLQAAFSTGFVAGETAAGNWLGSSN